MTNNSLEIAEQLLYLLQKYSPNKKEIISEIEQNKNNFNTYLPEYIKHCLAEIDRANNLHTNYSSEDLKIVRSLGSFL
ncbi:MAG: hypothetical protein IJ566_02545 [Cardiobacteriaceae bacterium]|nr:hypothetical protein [Cardiobacteriaceae bacterium]